MEKHELPLWMPLLKHATEKFTQSTVALLGRRPEGPLHNDTSGVLLEVADVPFLLTAAHGTVDYLKHHLPIFLAGLVDGSRVVSLEDAVAYNWLNSEESDVAVVRLKASTVTALKSAGMRFLRLDETEVGHQVQGGRNYVAMGFPISTFNHSDPKVIRMRPLPYVTQPYEGDAAAIPHFNPQYDWAFKFNPDAGMNPSGNVINLPAPEGMSGGGIWSLGDPKRLPDFDPADIRLVAIEHGVNRKRNAMFGAKLREALGLILKAAPDLKPSIQLHCGTSWPHVRLNRLQLSG